LNHFRVDKIMMPGGNKPSTKAFLRHLLKKPKIYLVISTTIISLNKRPIPNRRPLLLSTLVLLDPHQSPFMTDYQFWPRYSTEKGWWVLEL